MKKLLALLLLLSFSSVHAVTLKVGILAPEGTSWATILKKMSKEIKKKTDRKVKLKIYLGGAQGDEPDVLRKIRIGQLHGGIFSGKTLGDINGDVRVMEIPFIFKSDRVKAWNTLNQMTPFFNKGFEKNDFHNLGFFEMGMVYLVSKKKISKIKDLKNVKIWSWTGDPIVESMIKSMNLISVPLALPDVLSSLSNGIIDAAYSPPVAILALQWNTKVKYLVDFPISYSVGAFLVSKQSWNKISPENQKIVSEICEKYLKDLSAAIVKENDDSLEALKSMGVEFLYYSKEDYDYVRSFQPNIISTLKGALFSGQAYKLFESKKL